MSEYYRNYFLFDNEVRPVSRFDEDLVFTGKSLYDALRIIEGIPLFFEKHYQRLINTANIAEIRIPISPEELKKRIGKLIEVNEVKDGNVKLIFNRNDEKLTSSFLAYFVPFRYPTDDELINGIDTIFFKGERTNPNTKLIDKTLREATEQAKVLNRVFEVILVDRNGYITEGSRTNVFFLRDNRVYTTPLKDVLPGVTREYVINICSKSGFEILETKVHSIEISQFTSFFISGTSPGVLPVRKLNAIIFNTDDHVMREIMNGYQNEVRRYIDSHLNMVISSLSGG
jgi:branched-chain amino acid aminotransferase